MTNIWFSTNSLYNKVVNFTKNFTPESNFSALIIISYAFNNIFQMDRISFANWHSTLFKIPIFFKNITFKIWFPDLNLLSPTVEFGHISNIHYLLLGCINPLNEFLIIEKLFKLKLMISQEIGQYFQIIHSL